MAITAYATAMFVYDQQLHSAIVDSWIKKVKETPYYLYGSDFGNDPETLEKVLKENGLSFDDWIVTDVEQGDNLIPM